MEKIIKQESIHETIVKQMLESGYKEFNPNSIFVSSKKGYQKKFKDRYGIKYYVACYEYDWSIHPEHVQNFHYHKSWAFHGQFDLKDGRSFNFETVGWYFSENQYGHKVNTIKDVEVFFESLWKKLNCERYDRNY